MDSPPLASACLMLYSLQLLPLTHTALLTCVPRSQQLHLDFTFIYGVYDPGTWSTLVLIYLQLAICKCIKMYMFRSFLTLSFIIIVPCG